MQQTIQQIKERLQRRKEQHEHQQLRLERLEAIMQHTEEDIAQLEYTIEKLERSSKNERKRKIIFNKDIGSFFTHLCEVFDALQHRYHIHLNYRLACLIIHSRYRFRSRSRTPYKRYLSEATVLTYFKYERNTVGRTNYHFKPQNKIELTRCLT